MTISSDLAISPGLVLLTRPSPFLVMLGPVHTKGVGASMMVGFHTQHYHLNRRGTLHGGVMVSLADAALDYYLAEPGEGTGSALVMSTASLTMDFIASTGGDDQIRTTSEGLRTDSKLAFAQTLFRRGDRLIVHTSTVFTVFDGHV